MLYLFAAESGGYVALETLNKHANTENDIKLQTYGNNGSRSVISCSHMSVMCFLLLAPSNVKWIYGFRQIYFLSVNFTLEFSAFACYFL